VARFSSNLSSGNRSGAQAPGKGGSTVGQ